MDNNWYMFCLSDCEEACSSEKASEEQAEPPGEVDSSEWESVARYFMSTVRLRCIPSVYAGELMESDSAVPVCF